MQVYFDYFYVINNISHKNIGAEVKKLFLHRVGNTLL